MKRSNVVHLVDSGPTDRCEAMTPTQTLCGAPLSYGSHATMTLAAAAAARKSSAPLKFDDGVALCPRCNSKRIVLGPVEATGRLGGWRRVVTVDGEPYRCILARGSPVRVAFKPRGFKGFKWFGRVLDARSRDLWHEEVNKSTGARGMLLAAGVVTEEMWRPATEVERENRRLREAAGPYPHNVGAEGPRAPTEIAERIWREWSAEAQERRQKRRAARDRKRSDEVAK